MVYIPTGNHGTNYYPSFVNIPFYTLIIDNLITIITQTDDPAGHLTCKEKKKFQVFDSSIFTQVRWLTKSDREKSMHFMTYQIWWRSAYARKKFWSEFFSENGSGHIH